MKTYVITLSREFPKKHSLNGKPTFFRIAFKFGQMCQKCRKPVDDCRKDCCIGYPKKHTIRANYDLWRDRVKEIQEGNACLSIREWTGSPYRSKQREIARLTAEDGVGIQRLQFDRDSNGQPSVDSFDIDGKYCQPETLANNDGLELYQWREWFKDYDLTKPMAIIHFTNYRY